jgi:hypothetical protein
MKIHAFHKLLERFPMPLIPIFLSTTDGLRYVQNINDDGLVKEFLLYEDDSQNRLLMSGVTSPSEPYVGGEATFAFAFSEAHIVVGNKSSIYVNLKSQLNKLSESQSPFSLLEIGIALADPALIASSATACKRLLDSTSPEIARKWLDGAPLSPSLKSTLRQATEESIRPQNIRFGFAGPWLVMTALTSFCASKGSYRTSVARRLLGGSEFFINYDEIAGSLPHTLRIIIDATDAGPSRLRYHTSRARLNLTINNLEAFHDAQWNFRHSFYDAARKSAYNKMPFSSSGQEHVSFLMLASAIVRTYPDFVGHLNGRAAYWNKRLEGNLDHI